VSELVGYPQFLERREQRRTADQGRTFPGATGPVEPGVGAPPALECERIEPSRAGIRAAKAAALAAAVTPARGPVPRWRLRGPVPDR
jgi:hypothetical protein